MTYAEFALLQAMPYEQKLRRQTRLALEFYEEIGKHGRNVHVSVGGLDSITLLCWLRSLGLGGEDAPMRAVSVSSLEDKSIQKIHDQLGVEKIKPYKSKVEVLNDVGFPVLSKDKAGKIELICNPTAKNATVRHAIMTGDTGKQGGYRTGTRMQLPLKWRKLFCGPANEQYGTDYQTAPFKVSNKCCYYMKEKPADDLAKKNNSVPYLGLMASEGGQREKALIENGCNYYGKTTTRSCPFAIFTRQDLLRLAIELAVPVPEVYGTIEQKLNGTLYTTRAQRTGCSMCGFGIHFEKRPHRFDRLREDNPKEWTFWMYDCVTDPDTGEKYGWGRVLDYIGVGWEDDPYGNLPGQINMFGGETG